MSRRGMVAAGVVALWLAGMAALAHREFFSGEGARLARAALFVAPGADYYQILDHDRQIGFASSTVDTSTTTIMMTDLVLADLDAGGRVDPSGAHHRLSVRATMQLSRALRLQRFRYEVRGDTAGAPATYIATGNVQGDTLLTLIVHTPPAHADTQHVRLPGPLLLPSLVPMAIALGEQPKVGQQFTYQVFDPFTDSTGSVTVRVSAESLFVLPDSATFDAPSARWVTAHTDTVRAWRIEQRDDGVLTGWVDADGRMVAAAPHGRFVMQRSAYELAFENWSHGEGADPRPRRPPTSTH